MDDAAKKTALRMIPYGIYVLTAEAGGETAAGQRAILLARPGNLHHEINEEAERQD